MKENFWALILATNENFFTNNQLGFRFVACRIDAWVFFTRKFAKRFASTFCTRLTYCFFLSCSNFVISLLPAASSSSLYTKSRTTNLHGTKSATRSQRSMEKWFSSVCACFEVFEATYFFSRQWCLYSSTTFLNRVTVNNPYSLSSNINLQRKYIHFCFHFEQIRETKLNSTLFHPRGFRCDTPPCLFVPPCVHFCRSFFSFVVERRGWRTKPFKHWVWETKDQGTSYLVDLGTTMSLTLS